MATLLKVSEELRATLFGNGPRLVVTSDEELERLGLHGDELEEFQEWLSDYDYGGEADVWVDCLNGYCLEQFRASETISFASDTAAKTGWTKGRSHARKLTENVVLKRVCHI